MSRPTVNRQLLQRQLMQAGSLTRQTQDPSLFGGGRAGSFGAFAQIAAAGLGAFAQNRIRKQLAERDLAEQQAFSRATGVSEDIAMALPAATRQGLLAQQLSAQFQTPERRFLETQEGIVAVDPKSLTAEPVTMAGQTVKPFAKTQTKIDIGEKESAFEKETGKQAAQRLSEVQSLADTSFGVERNLVEIENAINQGAFVGPGATKVAAINEISAAFGLPADLESAANTRVIEQRVNDLTLQGTAKLKGAISEKELDLIKKTVLDLGSSELATRKAIATLRRVNDYNVQLGQLADNLNEEGRFVKDFSKEKRKFDKEFIKGLKADIKNDFGAETATQTPDTAAPAGGIKFLGFE